MKSLAISKTDNQRLPQICSSKLMTNLTNILEQENRLEIAAIESGLTIRDAIRATPVAELARGNSRAVTQAVMNAVLLAMEYFNIKEKMNAGQALQFAGLFVSQHGFESLEDLVICLRNAKLGKYGEVFNRIDGQIVFGWFNQDLNEKYETFDDMQANTKPLEMHESITTLIKEAVEKKREIEPLREMQSREKHVVLFREVIPEMSMSELENAKKNYQRAQVANLGDYFKDYVDAIDYEINKRNSEI
jgi:hypothetical protein